MIICHRFRVFCHWLVNHSTFGNIILLCIMCSSALLAVERPIEPPGQVIDSYVFLSFQYKSFIIFAFIYLICMKTIKVLDYIFTTVFTVELVLKLIAYGFILHKGSFCRSAFSLLDLLVVIVSLLSVYSE